MLKKSRIYMMYLKIGSCLFICLAYIAKHLQAELRKTSIYEFLEKRCCLGLLNASLRLIGCVVYVVLGAINNRYRYLVSSGNFLSGPCRCSRSDHDWSLLKR